MIEIGPNLSSAIATVAIAAMGAIFLWALLRR